MTEPIDDTVEQTAVPPAQPGAFEQLAALLMLVTDAAACAERLAELKTALAKVEKAERELSRREIFFSNETAAKRRELEEAEKAAAARQVKAVEAERQLEAAQEEIRQFRRTRDLTRYENLPGGGVRDWGPIGPPIDVPRSAPVEMETEPAPDRPAGSTLTRSMPKPRRSMRRVADA